MKNEIPEIAYYRGIRFNDILFLNPAQGNKRNLSLKRTRIKIYTRKILVPNWKGNSLDLENDQKLEGHWVLELIGDEKNGRFRLKAQNALPFYLNGTPTLDTWPLRGDMITFGYNVLEARSSKKLKQEISLERFVSKKIIESDLSILIEGETGTGKSTLAKIIHENSNTHGPFVALNIGAFNYNLIESELFGHKKGAFTGASRNKMGAVELAKNGTLFIDEIDSLSLDLQTKLLLFLDTLEFRPVGSETTYKVKTRLIFASGSSMIENVRQKKCRHDFYFRISQGAFIKLKPLRDSIDELEYALDQFCKNEHITISDNLKDVYKKYPWPGNYRQLDGHLKKKILLSHNGYLVFDNTDKELIINNLNTISFHKDKIIPLKEMRDIYAIDAYIRYQKNISHTARILEISKNTLKKILIRHDLLFVKKPPAAKV